MKPYAILPYLLQALAWPVAHFIFRINGTFTVHGKKNLETLLKNGASFIIASNHINELDPVVQRAILPFLPTRPLFWVSKPQDLYTWKGWRAFLYGDWFFKSWGAYPFFKGLKDYEQALQHHVRIIEDGYPLGMFPQGTRAHKMPDVDPRTLESHGGTIFLAQRTGVPVLPVAIYGTKGMDAVKLLIKRSAIEVHILPPVYFEKGKEIDHKTEAQKIIGSIYAAIPQVWMGQ